MPQLIGVGTPVSIVQNVIYALPSSACVVMSDASIEVSQSLVGPFAALTSGSVTAASFLRSPSSNTVVTCKKIPRSFKSGSMSAYVSKIIADGASNYWRLNESSGLTATDLIGGVNGIISGTVVINQSGPLISDGSSKSMKFNRDTPGQIQTNNYSLPIIFTFECWLNLSQTGGYVFSNTIYGGPIGTIEIGVGGSYTVVAQDVFGVGLVSGVRTWLPFNVWHHLVCVFNGTNVIFYMDGVLDASPVFSRTVILNQPLYIGFGNYPAESNYGLISEVALYPFALTSTQIASHYSLR